MRINPKAFVSHSKLIEEWENSKHNLRQTRDDLTLVVVKKPERFLNKEGDFLGIGVWVELYHEELGEIPIDQHRMFSNPPVYRRGEVGNSHLEKLFPDLFKPEPVYDPIGAFWDYLWDIVLKYPAQHKWGSKTGSSVTYWASDTDGYVSSTNATYTTARSGSGLAANTTADLRIGQSRPKDYLVEEGFISFDTSGLPDDATIDAITLEMWLTTDSSTADFITEAREYDWGASLTTADFRAGANLSALTLMASINSSGIGATGAYKAFTSETAFLSATNIKTGVVYLNLSSSEQRLNSAPTGNEFLIWESANTASTTNDPRITIEYTVGTLYTQSVAGAMGALTGSIAKGAQKALSGTNGALTGNITKLALKSLSGASGALTGVISKQTLKTLAGIAGDLTGVLTGSKLVLISLAGAMGDLSGSINRTTGKALSGAIEQSGSLSRRTLKGLTGSTAGISGVVATARLYYRVFEGTVGELTGTLAKGVYKNISGATGSLTGGISKLASIALSGTMGAINGVISRVTLKSLAGVAGSLTGALSTSFISGAVATFTQAVGGAISMSGSLTRLTKKNVSGVTAASGNLGKKITRTLSGSLSSITGSASGVPFTIRAIMKAGRVIKNATRASRVAFTKMAAGSRRIR